MGFTLDAVAAAAGVSKGGILYHFPGKTVLYRALVEREIATFEVDAAAPSTGAQAIASAYVAAGERLADDRNRLHLALMVAGISEPDALAPYHAWIRERIGALVAMPGGAEAAVRVLACDGLWLIEMLGGRLDPAVREPVLRVLAEGVVP
jgi:AcrR family transcriptional regulator